MSETNRSRTSVASDVSPSGGRIGSSSPARASIVKTSKPSPDNNGGVGKRATTYAQLMQKSSTSTTPSDDGLDPVHIDKNWKHDVNNEKKRAKNWETEWGFTTEVDYMGRPVEKWTPPENVTVYSDTIPNTSGREYGAHLNTEPAKVIQSLQMQLMAHNHKKKLDAALVCCD